ARPFHRGRAPPYAPGRWHRPTAGRAIRLPVRVSIAHPWKPVCRAPCAKGRPGGGRARGWARHAGGRGGMVAARPPAASLTAPAVVDYSGLTSGTRGHIPPDATPPYSSVSRGPPARGWASGRRLC